MLTTTTGRSGDKSRYDDLILQCLAGEVDIVGDLVGSSGGRTPGRIQVKSKFLNV